MKTMKTLVITVCAALAAGLLAGCASLGYGDGKVGPVPLAPAVQAVASAADAKIPGSGQKINDWFASSLRDRVPPGYALVWDSFLDGKPIDRSRIVDVPRLAPVDGSPVVVVNPPAPASASTLPPEVIDLLNQIGAATNPPAPAPGNVP